MVEKLRQYRQGTSFTIITTRHSLKWLLSIKEPIGTIVRRALRLHAYYFDIIHKKDRDHVVRDVLSRAVAVNYYYYTNQVIRFSET